ncbi:multidrug MFS transporter [Peribacillus muralis]|uniref:Multidrug MFS transporter n=1 Tax=Peribacillus muralis TaxID=264697 RepID=A0A1B3XK97_9BACI|nr:sugar transferase [Peribacillus muralis]AOH53626.1 multidrug MFS transporter [Peribacillus muralis]
MESVRLLGGEDKDLHPILEQVNENKVYLNVKRFIDVFGALVGMIIFLPIIILVVLLVKLENPKGSIFFKQVRIGKDGKEFNMYKFRSMVVDAEKRLPDLVRHNEIAGPMFKMKDDPRITRIGKFIRKTSIDELPQFWNVLVGEMSLVGPRPPLLREVKEYSAYDKQRLLVTPGCTGLWQVSGRNALSFQEMVELDLQYIKQRTIITDITIILRTVKVMILPNDSH